MTAFLDVDVRPTLRAGGEPFGQIMEAVNTLAPGQGLRLYATFRPTPLLHVLGSQGFTYETTELDNGDWEVTFTPSQAPADAAKDVRPSDESQWPAPTLHLDNRDLDPPEPMVKILTATESMTPGEVLSALLRREPTFLFPELAKRGHAWRGGFEPDGTTYKVLVRVGASEAAT